MRTSRRSGPGRGRKKTQRRPPRLLVADDAGRFYDHPHLIAAGQSWDRPVAVGAEAMAEPAGLQMVFLPGRRPIGLDPKSGQAQTVEHFAAAGSSFVPHAVAAVPPPGHARHLLPACAPTPKAPQLPLRSYTAVGLGRDGLQLAASRIDSHTHWDPDRFATPDLSLRISELQTRFPDNQLLSQLVTCARDYFCCTATNMFLGTFEAALPVSARCNARCLGCISEQTGAVDSPQQRLQRAPEIEHLVELAVFHLDRSRPAMVSFGQGCEGEPSCEAERIAQAIRLIRKATRAGAIHMNTNGSRPEVLDQLAESGLQSVRISLASAIPEAFDRYHQADFGLTQVEEFATRAVARGLFVSFNLLTFPGLTDRPEEAQALTDLLHRTGAHMIQIRNLDLDPERVLTKLQPSSGQPLGVAALIRRLRRQVAGLEIGSFNRFAEDWPKIRARRNSVAP